MILNSPHLYYMETENHSHNTLRPNVVCMNVTRETTLTVFYSKYFSIVRIGLKHLKKN